MIYTGRGAFSNGTVKRNHHYLYGYDVRKTITLGAGYARKLVVDGVTVRRGRYQGEWAVLLPTDARVRVVGIHASPRGNMYSFQESSNAWYGVG